MSLDQKSLVAFANTERDRFEATLREFVEIPTVSADPGRQPEIRRCAGRAAELIREFGGKSQVLETAGNPLVHGRFDVDPKLPTVTVYNHFDVQPASRQTEPWRTDPFVFTKQGDRYFGRGTTDDKGPALTALWGIRAARANGIRANIRVLWELEEEIGSPNFESGIKPHTKTLATDHVIVSDTIWVSRKQPACPAGLRGLQGFELVLETGETDQHSGTAGGAARNPIGEVMKRIWAMPTFEVHGVVGGYSGPGIKTIIPPRAAVKISCRIVPNQDPNKLLRLVRAFVKKHNPDVKVVAEAAMYPYKAPTTGPLADAVRDAMKFAFGREPVFVREGGSIGAVVSMEEVLKCPVVFLGLSLPEHGYHAPNENYDWQQASGGMVAFAKYFEEVSAL